MPVLCDFAGKSGGTIAPCLSAQQLPVSFSIGPPNTPFTVKIVESQPFALQPSLYNGSVLSFDPQPFYSNWGLGLSVQSLCPSIDTPADCNSFNVSFMPGNNATAPTVFTGLEPLYKFSGTPVQWLAAQFWGKASTFVVFAAGSVTGDLIPAGQSVWRGSYLSTSAMIQPLENSRIFLNDSYIESIPHALDNSRVYLERCLVTKSFVVDENAALYVADGGMSGTPSPFDLRVNGTFFFAQLNTPLNNSYYVGGLNDSAIVVNGVVWAFQSNGAGGYQAISPFPGARVDLVSIDAATDRPAAYQHLETYIVSANPSFTGLDFVTLNLTGRALPSGLYELQLRHNSSDGNGAVARRRFTYDNPNGGGGGGAGDSSSSSSTGGSAAAASSSSGAAAPASSSSSGAASPAASSSSSSSSSTGATEQSSTGSPPPSSTGTSAASSHAPSMAVAVLLAAVWAMGTLRSL
jgi:hypothetical protein